MRAPSDSLEGATAPSAKREHAQIASPAAHGDDHADHAHASGGFAAYGEIAGVAGARAPAGGQRSRASPARSVGQEHRPEHTAETQTRAPAR